MSASVLERMTRRRPVRLGLEERRARVGEGLPGPHRAHEGLAILPPIRPAALLAECLQAAGEDLAVRTPGTAQQAELDRLPAVAQDLAPIEVRVLIAQPELVQEGRRAALPVDQRAVAVEGGDADVRLGHPRSVRRPSVASRWTHGRIATVRGLGAGSDMARWPGVRHRRPLRPPRQPIRALLGAGHRSDGDPHPRRRRALAGRGRCRRDHPRRRCRHRHPQPRRGARWPRGRGHRPRSRLGDAGPGGGAPPPRRGPERPGRGRRRRVDAARLGSVDVAVSSFAMQLVPDRPAALREIRRVLRPGGHLAYITWLDRGEAFAPHDAFDEAVLDLGHRRARRAGGDPSRRPGLTGGRGRPAPTRGVRALRGHSHAPSTRLDAGVLPCLQAGVRRARAGLVAVAWGPGAPGAPGASTPRAAAGRRLRLEAEVVMAWGRVPLSRPA